MRERKTDKKKDPRIAFYLDEEVGNDDYESNTAEEHLVISRRNRKKKPREHEQSPPRKKPRRTTKRKHRKGKKKTRGSKIIKFFLIILLIVQVPIFYTILSSFEWRNFSSASENKDAKGILLLGVDNDGPDSIKTGHTDSITYIGANFKTKKAVSLAIYRDANINQVCHAETENINRIYRQEGIDCLVESTAAFLDLPIDYYIIITMDGLIDVVNALGGVEMMATGTYCSDYGEDGQTYCFEEGQVLKMTGPQALAYIRYRGTSSGEVRANRQLELIMGIKNQCMKHPFSCYAKGIPSIQSHAKTNLPITESLDILAIFSDSFALEKLEVVEGFNTTDEKGWTQIVDEQDKKTKADYIHNAVFLS